MVRHQLYGSQSVQYYPPTPGRTEIMKISVNGLPNGVVLTIRMNAVNGDITFSGTQDTDPLTFNPTVPISLPSKLAGDIAEPPLDIQYNIDDSRTRINNQVFVTYEMVFYRIDEVKTVEPNKMFVTREEVETLVDEKIKTLLTDMTEEDLDKLILEVRSRNEDGITKKKVK